jgi:hypothetical protein
LYTLRVRGLLLLLFIKFYSLKKNQVIDSVGDHMLKHRSDNQSIGFNFQ